MNKTELQKGVISIEDVRQRIMHVREQPVIIDADMASLYGVETKRVNKAVRNNPEKFPGDYMFELDDNESRVLRSKISTLEHVGKGRHSKYNFKAFTEKGLYMLATVLKSKRATDATFAIIETFVKVRGLKRELVELHKEADRNRQSDKMRHFGENRLHVGRRPSVAVLASWCPAGFARSKNSAPFGAFMVQYACPARDRTHGSPA